MSERSKCAWWGVGEWEREGETEREESSHLCEDRKLFLWFMHPTKPPVEIQCSQ